MASFRDANAFTQNFMQGFGFVDNAFRARRDERRLEERLAEERTERQFRRRMATERNRRAEEQLGFQRDVAERAEETHDRAMRERDLQLEGERLVAELGAENLTDEQLAQYAGLSPSVAAEVQRRGRQDRITGALSDIAPLRQGLSAGMSELPSSSVDETVDPEAIGGESQFAGSRGAGGLQAVSEAELAAIDPGAVPERRNILGQPKAPSEERNIMVPEEIVTPTELESINDPEARQAARARNQEIVDGLTQVSKRPKHNLISGESVMSTISLEEATERNLELARQAEAQVASRYESFLSSDESTLETLAAEDPGAAAVTYFQDRATLMDAKGADFVAQVDRRMKPVLDNYANQIRGEMNAVEPGSREFRQHQQRLANVITSRNEIASQQPSVSQQAGVRGGLPVGNASLVSSVTDVVTDPNRPGHVPNTLPRSRINAAMTTAGRITPNTRRLTDRQISALVTLYDEGMIDQQSFQSVITTGAFPPGKDPNSIKSLTKSGGSLWGLTEGGGVVLVAADGDLSRDDVGSAPDKEMTTAKIDTILSGARMANPNLTPEAEAAIGQIAVQHADYIRANFALTSEEQRLRLGQILVQSYNLAKLNRENNYNKWFRFGPSDDPENAPTGREMFLNPAMRAELAKQFDVPLITLPPSILGAPDVDWEAARQSIRDGDLLNYGIRPEDADRMTDNQLAYTIFLLNATPEQIEAAAQGEG